MSGPNSLAYKLLWKGSEKFGSLVPTDGSSRSRGAPTPAASAGGFDDEEEDDDDTGASASASAARKRAATGQDIDDDEDDEVEPPARRAHTTLTSDEDNDDDADVELVKAATEKVKARRGKPKFDPLVLCGAKGLPMLHDEMKKIKFGGPGFETADLHLLIRKYKEWCFQMFPTIPFEPLVDKIQALGGNRIVQSFVSSMADNIDRGRSVQELALGVEKPRTAYAPSDEEDDDHAVFGSASAPTVVSKPAAAVAKTALNGSGNGAEDEEDYDELLAMADEASNEMYSHYSASAPAASSSSSSSSSSSRASAAKQVDQDDELSLVEESAVAKRAPAPISSPSSIPTIPSVAKQTATPPTNPFASKAAPANPFGVSGGGFSKPFRAPTA